MSWILAARRCWPASAKLVSAGERPSRWNVRKAISSAPHCSAKAPSQRNLDESLPASVMALFQCSSASRERGRAAARRARKASTTTESKVRSLRESVVSISSQRCSAASASSRASKSLGRRSPGLTKVRTRLNCWCAFSHCTISSFAFAPQLAMISS